MSSVRLSVTLVDHDHIGWKSWKLIARTISPKVIHLLRVLPGEDGEILGRKCSLNTYVHNVRLIWVNRESRDLRWRCGCLFTFVGASRGHVCDNTAFLFCEQSAIQWKCCISTLYRPLWMLHRIFRCLSLVWSTGKLSTVRRTTRQVSIRLFTYLRCV